jgi:hypothetical protein
VQFRIGPDLLAWPDVWHTSLTSHGDPSYVTQAKDDGGITLEKGMALYDLKHFELVSASAAVWLTCADAECATCVLRCTPAGRRRQIQVVMACKHVPLLL